MRLVVKMVSVLAMVLVMLVVMVLAMLGACAPAPTGAEAGGRQQQPRREDVSHRLTAVSAGPASVPR